MVNVDFGVCGVTPFVGVQENGRFFKGISKRGGSNIKGWDQTPPPTMAGLMLNHAYVGLLLPSYAITV